VTSGFIALSGHIEVTDERNWIDVLDDEMKMLNGKYGIAHVTLQPEPFSVQQSEPVGCSFETPEGRAACLIALDR
jgi:hypothetical protein